jgi:tetratricopeptide (TPR) repeat protein
MRIELRDPYARWTFLFLVTLFSLCFIYLTGKAWLAAAWGASANPLRWQQAARLEPGNALYPERLGLFDEWDLEHRDLSKAVSHLWQATQINPWSAQFHAELAGAYEVQGNIFGAQREYELALADNPLSADVAWHYGSFLLRQRKMTEGFVEIRRAVQNDPSLTTSAIAECFAVDQDVGTIVDEALPRNSRAYLTALNYFVSQDQTDAASSVWNRVLELGKSFPMKQAVPFVDELIRENRLSEAEKVWGQALVATNWPRDANTDGSLVFNGGFEQDFLNGGFDWRVLQQPDISYSFDNTVAHSGKRSLRIEFDGNENLNFQHVFQYVPVRSETNYRLTAYLKTENISSDSGFRLEIVNPGNNAALPTLTQDVKGTAPWTEVHAGVRTGINTNLLEIVVRRLPSGTLDNELSGMVWIDDVALMPLAEKTRSRTK